MALTTIAGTGVLSATTVSEKHTPWRHNLVPLTTKRVNKISWKNDGTMPHMWISLSGDPVGALLTQINQDDYEAIWMLHKSDHSRDLVMQWVEH